WAGMTEVPALARRASAGPFPIPRIFGRALTAPNHGLIRSAFAGQGNSELLVAQRVDTDQLAVANVHLSQPPRAEAELASVLEWLADATPLVVAGDFNMTPELDGFSGLIPGWIDQVLARGAAARTRVWSDDERRSGGRLLSDHAPVEAEIATA